MTDNQYHFYFVFDERSEDGKKNATFKQYVMPGIPTKYFIDGNGVILFQSIGFNPARTTGQIAAEIEDTIEKVRAGK